MGKINFNFGVCPLCDQPFHDGVEKHHVIPRAKGGKLTVSICVPCHTRINKDKHYRKYANRELHQRLFEMGVQLY